MAYADITKQIRKVLEDDKRTDEVYKDVNLPNIYYITIEGDWYHDHHYVDHLVEQKCGLRRIGEKDVQESDGDFYESTHVYILC